MDMDGISGKRALVTGGGSGIGFGIAQELLKQGATVFIIGRSKERLDKAVSESKNKLIPIQVDVGNWSAVRDAVKDILPIQLLINNAGIAILNPALEFSEEDYDTSMNVNLKAVVNLTQFVAKDLVSRKMSGNIVNISSQASSRALPDHLVYSASKAALDMVTKSFAFELGSKNIRVNAVNPTVVLTEMGKLGWSDPAKAAGMLGRIPQGRFAEVEEVVNSVMFLLSDKSNMVNGHCLPVDGGFLTG